MNSAHKCILKVTGHPRGHAVRQRMQEMLDDPEALHIYSDGCLVTNESNIEEVFQEWKQRFKKGARNPRHAEHIVLSIKCSPSAQNLLLMTTATIDFLEKNLTHHSYFFAVKQSSPCPSIRLLIHSHNHLTKQQLHMPLGWATVMRNAWADALNNYGFQAEA